MYLPDELIRRIEYFKSLEGKSEPAEKDSEVKEEKVEEAVEQGQKAAVANPQGQEQKETIPTVEKVVVKKRGRPKKTEQH